MPRPFVTLATVLLVTLGSSAIVGLVALGSAAPADAQTAGPAAGVVYSARRGEAQVRLVGLGESPSGEELLLVDVKVECEGFEPEGRMVAVLEEEGRFEVEGTVSVPGTTDVITGEFDDIDGKVRSDGAVLEIDVEVEGEDNAGSTGRCEETQQWRLDAQRSAGAARIDGAMATDATELASNDDALFLLAPDDDGDGELSRVDPQTLTTTWTVDAPGASSLVAAAGDAVWLLDAETLAVTRVGALSGDVEATIPLELSEAAAQLNVISPLLVASPTAAWVAIDETESLYRIDAATNEVTIGTVPGRVDALGATTDGVDASVVAASGGDARLVHLDEQINEVGGASITDLPDAIAADPTPVWTRSTDRLAAYDPTSFAPTGEVTAPRLVTGALSDLVLALAPGAWTPTTRGLEAFAADLSQAFEVPVVGSASVGLAAAEDAVFVLDSGYLIRVTSP